MELTLKHFLQWAKEHHHPQVIQLYKNFYINVMTEGQGPEHIDTVDVEHHINKTLNGCKPLMLQASVFRER